MANIAENLETLKQIKVDLKEALISQGQEPTDDFSQYSTKLSNIPNLNITKDATATAEDILKGKTAYVNSEKIEGTYEGGGEPDIPDVEPVFTGHVDVEGLKQIGWTDEDIEYFIDNGGINWNEEQDELFKLTEKELSNEIPLTERFFNPANNINATGNKYNVIGIPKNKKCDSFQNFYSLRVVPPLEFTTTNLGYYFYYCYSLKKIPYFDASNITLINYLFDYCYSLKEIPDLDFSNVTNATYAFADCINLKKLPNINFKKVTNVSYMLSNCYNLRDIGDLDLSTATTCNNLFQYCTTLDIKNEINIKNATNISNMFANCYKLKKVKLNTSSKLANMQNLFNSCFSLNDVEISNTQNVTNAAGLFSTCFNLRKAPEMDLSLCKLFGNMFANCRSLTYIPRYDLKSATDISYMFNYCYALQTIPELDFSNVTNSNSLFTGCSSLTNVPDLDLRKSTNTSYLFMYCNSLSKAPNMILTSTKYTTQMFQSCYKLTYVPDIDIPEATTITSMFRDCSSIKKIKLKGLKVTSAGNAFQSTPSLTILDLSEFKLSGITSQSSMFSSCGTSCKASDGAYANNIPYIIVMDEADQNWVLTKSNGKPSSWTTANVVVAGSEDDPRV